MVTQKPALPGEYNPELPDVTKGFAMHCIK
jgi:hypothetical protein